MTSADSWQSLRQALALTLLTSLILAAAGCSKPRELMPTPAIYTVAGPAVFENVPEPLRDDEATVIFATDRVPVDLAEDGEAEGEYFTWRRSQSLIYGTATVKFNGAPSWEKLVEASTTDKRKPPVRLTIGEVKERVHFPETPLPFVTGLDGRQIFDPEAVKAEREAEKRVHKLLDEFLVHADRKEALVFIHGFNVPFNNSVLDIAEMWHFGGREGVPIVYSWPAGKGGITGYAYDRESGEFTIYHLKTFIRALARHPEIRQVNYIAHSRGVDVLASALRDLEIESSASGQSARSRFKIGQVVLAAPDMDIQVADQRYTAEGIHRAADHYTIYSSPGDKALNLANWFFDSIYRLGSLDFSELADIEDTAAFLDEIPNVDLVEVDAKTRGLGHSYFRSSPAVSSDIILLLRYGHGPGTENGRPLKPISTHIWELNSGYPFHNDYRGEAE